MSNRVLFSGAPTVEVDLVRYDALLHYEERLEMVLKLIEDYDSLSEIKKLPTIFSTKSECMAVLNDD